MDRAAALRILDLYERFSKTEGYKTLLEEYHYQNDRLMETAGTLTQEQLDVIFGYLDVYFQFYDKLVEFACSE